ncbi:MAG TPA: glycosyltransferase [Candidatus Angelobacter sp.]|nr:glycosyltransferase [Candidatus Angelobacter sp.]
MKSKLNIALFSHSLVSDWNHGNAHFLRGLARELVHLGHGVRCYEELGCWSMANLMKLEGQLAIQTVDLFRSAYPELDVRFYQSSHPEFQHFLEQELRDAHVVILHEWNAPNLVNSVLALKQKYNFIALFYDSHHRAYTRAREILRFHLHLLDGVLAFGESVRRIYSDGFGVSRTWTFHEAADLSQFGPMNRAKEIDLVWIGNWGDEERTHELEEFLMMPARVPPRRIVVAHGVRYPPHAIEKLSQAGIEYRGYLPNLATAEVYAASSVALHVPRQQYANGLKGVATIRVFEALACGVPLLCSPWEDEERLFHPGLDYLVVRDARQMKAELEMLLGDARARRQIAEHGMKTIRKRHTCAHRAQQLISICEELAA